MRRKVAVERNLQNVRQYFESQGYKVDIFDGPQIYNIKGNYNYDAIIVAGGNKDFLGIQDAESKTPVIDATGMTAQDIYNRVTKLEF